MELSNEVVCFGEVLWDILPDKSLPGGAPMNVAYHLKKQGLNPAMITKTGDDDYGRSLIKIISAAGITTDYFQLDENQPTGLVYAKVNDHHEVTYDIVYPSAWDFIEWNEACDTVVRNASFFVFGSLASRSAASRETLYKLLEAANTKVLDINLRPPHYNREGLEYLLNRTDILKMNESELKLIAGWFDSVSDTEQQLYIVQEKFPVKTLIVTLGGDGAMIMDKGQVYRHSGFKVAVADTIGSGDSFLAGYLSQILRGNTVQNALNYASAVGAFIATQNGGCPDYQLEEVLELMYKQQLPA